MSDEIERRIHTIQIISTERYKAHISCNGIFYRSVVVYYSLRLTGGTRCIYDKRVILGSDLCGLLCRSNIRAGGNKRVVDHRLRAAVAFNKLRPVLGVVIGKRDVSSAGIKNTEYRFNKAYPA